MNRNIRRTGAAAFRRTGLAGAFLALCSVLSSAQGSAPPRSPAPEPRPVAFRDVLSFQSVSGLLSPDGRTVLFTVERVDLEKNATLTSAWKVPFEGGEPVPLTRESAGDRIFQWSPDGRLISFLGERETEPGLFVMRPDGGEPRKLFSHDQGILQYQWSPDGLRIAFVSPDKPSDEEDLARKEKRDVVVEGGDRRMSHIWIYDLGAGREWPLTSGGEFNVHSFAWSPDSRSVAFAAAPSPSAADYIRSDIYGLRVEMPDGPPHGRASGPARPTKLTDNAGEDLLPQYAPDGRFIVYRSRPAGDLVGGYRHLKMAAGGSSPEDISPRADISAGSYAFGPDGRTVYFAGVEGVESNLYRMSLEDRRPVRLTPGKGVWQSPSYSADKKRCVFTFQDPRHPQELFAAPVSDTAGRRLTDLNGRTAGALQLGETEVVSWRAPDGRPVDGLLVRPRAGKEARGRKHPLIVEIHGGPAGLFMLDFSPEAHYFAGLGYIVFRPNFRGSAGYGEAFRRADIGDWGGGDFRDILAGIEAVLAGPDADADRVGVMGWSFGGYMTAWMVARTSLFKAAVVGAGMVDNVSMWGTQDSPPHYAAYFGGHPFEKDLGDLYRDRSPLTHIRNIGAPVLILHGEEDKRVPASQALLFYNALKAVGGDAELVRYPRTGHAPQEPCLRLDVVQRQAAWFSRHLLGTEMPLWPKEGAGQGPRP